MTKPSSSVGGRDESVGRNKVNADSASSAPPASRPTQLELFPGRACPRKAKPATDRVPTSEDPVCRDGVQGGGTRRQSIRVTGETLFGPAEEASGPNSTGREAYKGEPRNRRPKAEQGVGGGRSTVEPRDNRGEGRAASSTTRSKRGKAAGLHPRGFAQPRPANCNERSTGQPSCNRKGGSPFSTTRCADPTS